MNSMRLKQKLKDFLQQRRYVVVLDDVWNLEALEGIKNALPNNSFCSRIIITTRKADIATVSSHHQKFILILKECEGLPLAIVAIGGLLFANDVQEWEMITRSLAAELESDGRMKIFGKILSLSYNDLHDNLKSRFLYLGVFPEDHVIECSRLIRLWIAEGFVEEREGMTQEEVAERYLKELINRSLVQNANTASDGRLRRCRVHDLTRESILSKLRDENFVSFASEQRKELHETVRRLSVQYTGNIVLNQLSLPRLRSLLIFELGKSTSSDEQFFPSNSKLLKVLDLGGSSLDIPPTNTSSVPLETLVSELPVEITKLKKLQYLVVYRDSEPTFPLSFGLRKGISAPEGMGALKSLQKLCCVKAGGGRGKNIMQELGELSQLTRLGVTELKTDNAKELCHSLEKMTKLRSLEVTAESESEVIDLDLLSSPPLLLRSLYIEGCLKKVPHWLPLLNNLTRLRLGWSRSKSSPLIALQNLPNLLVLELINNAFDGETLVFGDGGFPKLKELALVCLENLRFVSMNGQAMPCLQSLVIAGCRHLDWQSLLVVIRDLSNLEELQFYEMPEEFALAFYPNSRSRTREGIGQECYEEVMGRNPEVRFFWEKGDRWEKHDLSLDSYNVIQDRVTR
ncbi:disease resistance protein RPM1-like [Rhodamnia argentea]|uniref:Disease resistance protein RPM1-like n=1 Tax=Rhodamnia argentea TaxID=178133 RepID=A0ABM3HBU1_9MYRT|nr:disease resistance protein RPM1-like [Rhodamnia argentea]